MRLRLLALTLVLVPGLAFAQDRAQTLADIKAELASLNGEFNALKNELMTSGVVQSGAAGGSALQRLDSIEQALAAKNRSLEEASLAEMDALWNEAKAIEKADMPAKQASSRETD